MFETVKRYCRDPKNASIVDVACFIVLILVSHYLFLGWQALGYWPISKTIENLSVWAVNLVYGQSCWVLENVFHIDITTVREMRIIATPDNEGGWVKVIIAPECASLKQWCHWLFLMLLFPGPWRHKAWFIPAGLVVIEWTNVVRICGVFLMQIPWPKSFHIAHDYIFKAFFYFIIFLMWVLWVECFVHPKKKKKKEAIVTETNN